MSSAKQLLKGISQQAPAGEAEVARLALRMGEGLRSQRIYRKGLQLCAAGASLAELAVEVVSEAKPQQRTRLLERACNELRGRSDIQPALRFLEILPYDVVSSERLDQARLSILKSASQSRDSAGTARALMMECGSRRVAGRAQVMLDLATRRPLR